MIAELLSRTPEVPFRWIDVTTPSREELQRIATEYRLHPRLVDDCLDPEHLPKFESINDETFFLITRSFDPHSSDHADTVQALTRKVAIFFGADFLITVHSVPLPLVDELKSKWQGMKNGKRTPADLAADCLNAVLRSFDTPLEKLENAIDRFEETLFANREVMTQLREIHVVKRRASAFKRVLWHTASAIQRLQPREHWQASLFQDLKENCEATFVYSDELLEEINALQNTHLSMASHRTNEVVRVLTVFSVFFLPLTFIVGIYGMNFKHMPELEWQWGYPFALLLMIGISAIIFVWFKRKGFLR